MRLRKNLKRTAAAALALSMAVSAAVPASASYVIDMSKVAGDVTITKDESGKVTVDEGSSKDVKDSAGVKHIDDGKDDDITINGSTPVDTMDASGQSMDDAPKAEENAPVETDASATEEEATDPAPEEDETSTDTEETPEDNYAFSTMELTPEDYGQPADSDDGETKEPARTVTETEDGTVISYEDYTVDPDVQVTMPEAKAETPAPEEKADKEETYAQQADTSTNAIEKIAKTAVAAVKNVIKIINQKKDTTLNVTLNDVNIDVSDTGTVGDYKNNYNYQMGRGAATVEGAGNVDIKLKGNNILKSGVGHAGLEKNVKTTGSGFDMKVAEGYGSLTIDSEAVGDDDYAGSLNATGGWGAAGIGGGVGEGFSGVGKSTSVTIKGGNITAVNGVYGACIGGGGSQKSSSLNDSVSDNGGNAIIDITGGNIFADMGKRSSSAGIGGGGSGRKDGGVGLVRISGGSVVAKSDDKYMGGTGIGGGDSSQRNGGDGFVEISGGTITAATGYWSHAAGAGIGGGYGAKKGGDGTVKITGGTIEKAYSCDSAGIGGGAGANGGNGFVTIVGNKKDAVLIKNATSQYGAGIGGGENSASFDYTSGGNAEITIIGNAEDSVTIESVAGATGIGGCGARYSWRNGNATINITGHARTSVVIKNAKGERGAGIGSGYSRDRTYDNNSSNIGTVTIKGDNADNVVIGEVVSTNGGAGIGGGYGYDRAGIGKVTIENATIGCAKGVKGAGIGNGSGGNRYVGGFVKIVNAIIGKLTQDANGDWTYEKETGAIGGTDAAGIGGVGMKNDAITIEGDSFVAATSGNANVAAIGKDTDESYTLSDNLVAHDIPGDKTTGNTTLITPKEPEPEPQPDPVTPEENGSDGIAALELRVTDAEGVDMPFAVSQSGAVRTYTADADTATLTGSMETLAYLKENGASTITFVTNQQTTSFAIDDLLAQNSSATFYLTHTGAEEAQMLVVE